jgi:hypothetical protein
MPRGKYPRKVSWKQVSSQLRDLQDRLSRHQGQFRAAGRSDPTIFWKAHGEFAVFHDVGVEWC